MPNPKSHIGAFAQRVPKALSENMVAVGASKVIILFVLDAYRQNYNHISHAQRLTPWANHC
ncbi:MAG: hypothetical protein KME49_14835 [Brasilonema octagenarum HA4186-MV1]|uniref:hypothetical protein n=1 Tax=Brasilonema TaxID=383614 RepID=UPI00145C6896|nr:MULTISPECIES: hypothetical protein [Brasilonema]MBW4626733.1 hypothetical protein [Brasilonema octagenarum HA4186-MV1]